MLFVFNNESDIKVPKTMQKGKKKKIKDIDYEEDDKAQLIFMEILLELLKLL